MHGTSCDEEERTLGGETLAYRDKDEGNRNKVVIVGGKDKMEGIYQNAGEEGRKAK